MGINISTINSVVGTANGAALSRAGGNSAESTTTSTSAVSLITITVSIAQAVFILFHHNGRKTSGAASAGGFGLQVNSTVVREATTTQHAATGVFNVNNEAQDLGIRTDLYPTSTNYLVGVTNIAWSRTTATGAYSAGSNNINALSAQMPNAAITSLVIRAISTASVTVGAQDAGIYTFAVS